MPLAGTDLEMLKDRFSFVMQRHFKFLLSINVADVAGDSICSRQPIFLSALGNNHQAAHEP